MGEALTEEWLEQIRELFLGNSAQLASFPDVVGNYLVEVDLVGCWRVGFLGRGNPRLHSLVLVVVQL